ncbi:hypothetical protein T11_17943 [Trichinella zimbabwensis]|uniref:Uncharacterized protein n=1 Tax=Trichinella zimbabwensis TaxID=268475 RepID=A0A0V1HVD2_9BILA|nr:hypothetical protein T11_17943 [Trichinella zimbabwensis]
MDSKAIRLLIAFFVLFPKNNYGYVLELYKAKNGSGNLNHEVVGKSAFGFFIPIVIIAVALLNLAALFYLLCIRLFMNFKKLYQHCCQFSPKDDEEKLLEFVDSTFLI